MTPGGGKLIRKRKTGNALLYAETLTEKREQRGER